MAGCVVTPLETLTVSRGSPKKEEIRRSKGGGRGETVGSGFEKNGSFYCKRRNAVADLQNSIGLRGNPSENDAEAGHLIVLAGSC